MKRVELQAEPKSVFDSRRKVSGFVWIASLEFRYGRREKIILREARFGNVDNFLAIVCQLHFSHRGMTKWVRLNR